MEWAPLLSEDNIRSESQEASRTAKETHFSAWQGKAVTPWWALRKEVTGPRRTLWDSWAPKPFSVLLPKSESKGEVAQSCLTLCKPMDCSLPGYSIRGILQARVLEWVTISFSRGSSQPRDRTRVSRIGGRHFNLWATREAQPWSFGCTFIFPL